MYDNELRQHPQTIDIQFGPPASIAAAAQRLGTNSREKKPLTQIQPPQHTEILTVQSSSPVAEISMGSARFAADV